jgi:(p)ppGpp synthase/HD superfamily hydrolase
MHHRRLADCSANELAELIRAAWRFAAHAHRDQQVPGTQLPYLLHLAQVASELAPALRELPVEEAALATCVAILHDSMEDCAVTSEELTVAFGEQISAGVRALSKNAALTKEQRMPECLARIVLQPRAIWMVKLADRITNLGKPPDAWNRDKRLAYRQEAQLILERLGAASEYLARRMQQCIADYASYCR